MWKTKEKNENLIKIYKSNYLAVKNNNKIKEKKEKTLMKRTRKENLEKENNKYLKNPFI